MFTQEQLLELSGLFKQVAEIFANAGVIVKEVVEAEVVTPENVVELPMTEPRTVKETVQPPLVEKEEVIESEVVEEDGEEEIDLESMTIAELRKLAKELGLESKGKKVELIERISNYIESDEEEVEDVEEDEIELEEESLEVDVEEDEADEEEEETEEDEEISLQEQVEEALAESSLQDLKDILEEAGLSTKGKRQALISRIIDGIEQGVIEFESDEDEDAEEEESLQITEDDLDEDVEVEDEEEIEIDLEEEEEDEDDEEESIREQVMEAIQDDMRKSYAKKEITDKEIAKFLETYSNGTFKAVNKKRALDKYIEIHANLVDDDGEVHDLEDPYYANGEAHCCASELETLDNGNLYCEVCGTEYTV